MDFQFADAQQISIAPDDANEDMGSSLPAPGRHAKPDFGEETVLLEALRARDESAFESLVATHGERMHAVARRFFSEEEDAKDAVQEAFISAYRAIDRFGGQSRLSTWLHRVVVNACLMKLRSRRRKPEQSLDQAATERLVSRSTEDVQLRLERAENVADVQGVISTLPEHHRRILYLRDIEERDTRETAALLSISPAAVKTRLHRARTALRTRIVRGGESFRSKLLSQSA